MKRLLILFGALTTVISASEYREVNCEWFANQSSNCWVDFVSAAERCSWGVADSGVFDSETRVCTNGEHRAEFDIPIKLNSTDLNKINDYKLFYGGKLCISYHDQGKNFTARGPAGNYKMEVVPVSEMLLIECPDGQKYTLPYSIYTSCADKDKPGLSFIQQNSNILIGLRSSQTNFDQFIRCRTTLRN